MNLIPSEIGSILALVLTTTALIYGLKSLRGAVYSWILLAVLMHKEMFSLVLWDFLPARSFLLGILIASIIFTIKKIYKNGFNLFLEEIKAYFSEPLFLLMILMLFFRGLSVIFGSGFEKSSVLFYGFFALAVFSVILIVKVSTFEFIKKIDAFNLFLNAYITSSTFAAVFGLIQYYLRVFYRESIGGVWVVPNVAPRLGSFFWDVNHYGGFLVTVIPILFIKIFNAKTHLKKSLYFLLFGLNTYLLFMTQSRSSWIGLSAGAFVACILFFLTKLRKPLYIGATLVILLVIGIIGVSSLKGIDLNAKIERYMHYRLDSTDTHLMLLDAASEVYLDNFVFGSGYGSFDTAFRKTETANDYFDREPLLRNVKVPSHSIWGEVMAEGGSVGIMLFASFAVILFGVLLYSIFNIESKTSKYLGIGLVWGLSSIFVSGIFYSYNIEFFWIYIGLCIAYFYRVFDFKPDYQKILDWWKHLSFLPYLLLGVVSSFYIFIKISKNSLIDYDEAIYAKVARNIYETGNWVSLTWENYRDLWFEKPPFYMWATSGFFNIFGLNEFSVRLTSSLLGLATILAVYYWGSKAFSKFTGIAAGLILLSTTHYLYYSRIGMLDVSVSFFILASLLLFWIASDFSSKFELTKRLENLLFIFAGILIGLGILTKSLIGMLPLLAICLTIAIFAIWYKHKIKWFGFILLLVSMLFVAAPWHIIQYSLHGEKFIEEYFMEHIIERGTEGLGHANSWFWYLEVIKVSFRIWIFPLFGGLVGFAFMDKKNRKTWLYLLICTFSILLFFSASKDKLQWYIIPIYPFLALIAARFIDLLLRYTSKKVSEEVSFSQTFLKNLGMALFIWLGILYIPFNSSKIYLSDGNKDRVALIKINNHEFPIERFPERKFYYTSMAKPVVLFYSDHQPRPINKKNIFDLIKDAGPYEGFSFLTTASNFYEIREYQSQYPEFVLLEVDGSAGEWVLFKSKSRVDILIDQYEAINKRISAKLLLNVLDLTVLNSDEEYKADKIRSEELIKELYDKYKYVMPEKNILKGLP